MTWFNEQDNADLASDNRSLVIAAANLLQRFEFDLPPRVVGNLLKEADRSLDYWSLERAFEEFDVNEYAEDGGWPNTNLAIVKQRRMDTAQAGVVDHYSLVADQRAHSIIDSLDGKIKSANEYGPILSWASYTYDKQENPVTEKQPVIDENVHVLKEGENIWDVSRQYNIPVAALIAENDIEDPRHVSVGTELYLPARLPIHDTKAITYELLHPARAMHVSREAGAKKWSFGGVHKWEDLYSTGRLYPCGHNLTIVAVAHVPIGEDTAAYYMDAVSLGEYETTGQPRYTNGFNWQHLAEGHTKDGTPPIPEITVEQVVADAMQEETRPELIPEPVAAPAAPELPIMPISYKSSFKFLNEEKTPVVYLFKEALTIKEIDGKLPDRHVGKYDGVNIIGTFTYNGIEYGRPALKNYWYGVPMDMIEVEDEVYNTDVDLPTRVAMRGHLSRSERRLVAMAKAVSNYQNFTKLFRK